MQAMPRCTQYLVYFRFRCSTFSDSGSSEVFECLSTCFFDSLGLEKAVRTVGELVLSGADAKLKIHGLPQSNSFVLYSGIFCVRLKRISKDSRFRDASKECWFQVQTAADDSTWLRCVQGLQQSPLVELRPWQLGMWLTCSLQTLCQVLGVLRSFPYLGKH